MAVLGQDLSRQPFAAARAGKVHPDVRASDLEPKVESIDLPSARERHSMQLGLIAPNVRMRTRDWMLWSLVRRHPDQSAALANRALDTVRRRTIEANNQVRMIVPSLE